MILPPSSRLAIFSSSLLESVAVAIRWVLRGTSVPDTTMSSSRMIDTLSPSLSLHSLENMHGNGRVPSSVKMVSSDPSDPISPASSSREEMMLVLRTSVTGSGFGCSGAGSSVGDVTASAVSFPDILSAISMASSCLLL